MIPHPLPSAQRSATWLIESATAPFCQPRRLPPALFVATVLLFAFGLRFTAATGPLWLDEIWSLELAQQASSARAVLAELRSDNNHVLNTLYLRAVGPNRPAILYRLPAVILGTASVGLGGWIAARWGRIESITAFTLLASSYLLVHYSSEARGYSPALFCALSGWESLLRYFESPRWSWVAAFWGSCFLGLLAHPIFVHFLLAAGCWSVTAISSRASGWRDGLQRVAVLFLMPAVVAGVSYWSMWRELELGGGPPYSFWQVLSQTGSLAVGGPTGGWGAVVAAAIVAIVCAAACWRLRADRLHAGLFLLVAILTPVVHALAVRPPFLFPRYFLMSVVYIPIVSSVVLASLYRRRRWGRWVYAGLLLTLIATNMLLTARLVTLGRGQYLAALNYLARTTDETTLTISSDHNFGVRKLIEFYSSQMPSHPAIQYYHGSHWPPCGPRWLILHRYAESYAPLPASQQDVDGHQFRLERMFDCAILSGWQWWCYRRVP